jgi:hypothetical protein
MVAEEIEASGQGKEKSIRPESSLSCSQIVQDNSKNGRLSNIQQINKRQIFWSKTGGIS